MVEGTTVERIQFIDTGDGIEAYRFGYGHIEFRRRLRQIYDRPRPRLCPVEFAKCSDLV